MVLLDIPLLTLHAATNTKALVKDLSGKPSASSTRDPSARSTTSELLQRSRSSIYSVDVNLKSNRYATGGGDNKVKIWTYDTLFRNTKNDGKVRRGARGDIGESELTLKVTTG
jgi:WD40 repeat protein